MDLTDVTQRIFRRHWALIILLALVGAAAPLLLLQVQSPTYVATARFVIGDTGLIKTDGTSLADTALGLATSSGTLEPVLKGAHVHEDMATVVPEVTVAPVGTSGVLDLSVSDANARDAAAIAKGLVDSIVQQRQALLQAPMAALLGQTNTQIGAIQARIAAIENASHGYLAPGDQAGLALRHNDALAIRNSLLQTQQQLQQQLATVTGARVLDDSMSTGVTDNSALSAKIAIGALLGLILGIAIAATREAIRPTYNAAGLARHLDAPLLGALKGAPTAHSTLHDPLLASYIGIAADKAGVRSVQLVPVGRKNVDLSGLARSLREGGRDVVPLALPRNGHSDPDSTRLTRHDPGIVVVAPKSVRSTYLAGLERHLMVTKQPVIGVVTYSGGPVRAHRVDQPADERLDVPEQSTAAQQPTPSVATVS